MCQWMTTQLVSDSKDGIIGHSLYTFTTYSPFLSNFYNLKCFVVLVSVHPSIALLSFLIP